MITRMVVCRFGWKNARPGRVTSMARSRNVFRRREFSATRAGPRITTVTAIIVASIAMAIIKPIDRTVVPPLAITPSVVSFTRRRDIRIPAFRRRMMQARYGIGDRFCLRRRYTRPVVRLRFRFSWYNPCSGPVAFSWSFETPLGGLHPRRRGGASPIGTCSAPPIRDFAYE